MNKNEIWQAIGLELRKAKKDHPSWPDHPAGQAGIVCQASGLLMRSCLSWKYDRDSNEVVQSAQIDDMKSNAIKAAVAAIRFLENLKEQSC